MLKNFFKTAVRNLLKHQAYSLINFIGLTCGLALALLIATYVRSELSYDKFHTHADRLYRLSYYVANGLKLASTPPPIAPAMQDFFPEVEDAGRIYNRSVSIKRPDRPEIFEEADVLFADSSIMDMLTFTFLKGTPARALHDKFTVLINEDMATKYFGNENPIGQTLLFGGNQSFKVTGVVKKFPENSHLRFNMLVPYDNMFDLESTEAARILRNNLSVNFVISHSYTYVLLKPGAQPEKVDARMEAFLKKHARPELLMGQVFKLMPVTDIHLRSDLLAEPTDANSISNIYIFIGVGILTLLIACINYINLSTAQSFTRVREIGIRKILGSFRHQLILQFLAESFLFCLIALILSYAVFYATLPFLNALTNKTLVFSEVVDGQLILITIALLILITLLAGGYPAYFVTRFESVNALKGTAARSGSQFMRKALITFQLMVACALLSGSLLIIKQLRFLTDRPLGFNKEHVINIPLFSQNMNGIFRTNDSTFDIRLQAFRDGIKSETNVISTALSSGAPGLGAIFRGTIPEGFTQQDNLLAANISVDYDFPQTYGLQVIAGRAFSRDYGTDAAEGYMVNETAIKEFNWGTPEKAIGKTMTVEGKKGKIIGVVKDFNFNSLTTPISAIVMEINNTQFNTLSVKFENDHVQSTIEKLRARWNELFPEKTFEFTFLDQQLDQQYDNFQNFGLIIEIFTIIAVIIACLGVYGLVLFAVQRKVKEIGVRKVLGASIIGILRLISKDFAILVVFGFILAVPLSYYFMNKWLENFIYHTNLDVITYAISLIMVTIIVFITISYQALKASLTNPVNSLRSE